MELQLGLALPTHAAVDGFDLNSYVHEAKDIVGSHPRPSWNTVGFAFLPTKCTSTTNDDIFTDPKKRSFDEAFDQLREVPPTLPLLHWTNQPNDEDDPKDLDNNSSFSTNKISEEDGVVGWPPIKNLRKKQRHQHHGDRAAAKNNQTLENGFGCGVRQSNSMFVKVKMEGVAIARKIDLRLHDSFQTLTSTLISMFGLWSETSNTYELTYQDKEGDWLIAQDVSWRAFIRTVQRLKLFKRSD